MKKYYFLFIILFVYTIGQAQIISFVDPIFKSKLLESDSSNFIALNLNGDYFAIDANNNNEIEVVEALEVSFLELSSSSISSLNGIDNFINLVSLQCQNNQITTLNVNTLTMLTVLDCSNNQLNFLNINGLLELNFLNCSFNQLTNLNANGLASLVTLDCSYNNLNSLGLNNLINLEQLNCSTNQIPTLDLTDLVGLKNLDCATNLLTTLSTQSVVSLEQLNCNNNLIATISLSGLNNLAMLNCTNNVLTTLNLLNLPVLQTINCDFNQLPLINLNGITSLKNLSCTHNLITILNIDGLSSLENVYCQNNQISTIESSGVTNLQTLNCDFNQVSTVDLNSLPSIKYLYCNNNQITNLSFTGMNLVQVVSCNNNLISTLNTSSLVNLQALYCSNNQLTNLDLSASIILQSLFCSTNLLTQVSIKNGSTQGNLEFSGNPNLAYICADELETEYIQGQIQVLGYDCEINTYCTFVPGGIYYTIQGNSKFDLNNNGCDAPDVAIPYLQFSIWDGVTTENNFANALGNYSKKMNSGTYTIAPILENPTYFLNAPTNFTVEFPFESSPFNQNFCVSSFSNHYDLEVAIFPISNLIPNANTTYKIVFKNKGTVAQSGSVSLNFNDVNFDFMSSNPSVTSQNNTVLNWFFASLTPFETRTIEVQMTANNTISVGQLATFAAVISSSNTDEMPIDNSCNLNQIAVNSYETNDKKCIEGTAISESQVGEYLHYIIRFKNSGTAIAQNIVVKDIIDAAQFSIASLIPLNGSHPFTTRISNNTAEFIFETINLSNTTNNEGFVAFKIRTVPTLISGSIVSNTASIYFSYDAPILTNTATTVVQSLGAAESEINKKFMVFPNPVTEILNLRVTNEVEIKSMSIYNVLGQLVKTQVGHATTITVSHLEAGVYVLLVTSERGSESLKFIKE